MLKRHQTSNLSVRFAQNEDEIRAAQRLRYRVFVDELGAKTPSSNSVDKLEIDEIDAIANHLCLFDQNLENDDPENSVVGVYRLMDDQTAHARGGFYSESEFDLTPLESLRGRKLELGRSCLDIAYRGGAGVAMLWQALGEYIEANEIDWLFGCASYRGLSLDDKLHSLSHLHHNYRAPQELRVKVRDENRLDWAPLPQSEISVTEAMRSTPSLIKSYLRWGGSIGEGAYVDHDFNTIDLFILMETQSIVQRYKTIYEQK